jgi:hypothetical protein
LIVAVPVLRPLVEYYLQVLAQLLPELVKMVMFVLVDYLMQPLVQLVLQQLESHLYYYL